MLRLDLFKRGTSHQVRLDITISSLHDPPSSPSLSSQPLEQSARLLPPGTVKQGKRRGGAIEPMHDLSNAAVFEQPIIRKEGVPGRLPGTTPVSAQANQSYNCAANHKPSYLRRPIIFLLAQLCFHLLLTKTFVLVLYSWPSYLCHKTLWEF